MNLHIPGALSIEGEASQSVALVLDSPHSGAVYPADFEHQAASQPFHAQDLDYD